MRMEPSETEQFRYKYTNACQIWIKIFKEKLNRIGKDYRAMSVNGVNTTCVKRLRFEWISWVFNPPWKWLIKFRHPPLFNLIISREVNHCNIHPEIIFDPLQDLLILFFPIFLFFSLHPTSSIRIPFPIINF